MAGSSLAVSGARPRRPLVGPLVLVGVGLLLLLNNLEALPWSIWADLWPYWPALLVLLGLEALATGRLAWGWLALTLVLVGIGGVAIEALSLFGGPARPNAPPSPPPTHQFRQELAGAARGLIRVDYGGGSLHISALDDAGAAPAAGVLAEGRVHGGPSATVETRYRVRDGVGELRVEPRDGDGLPVLAWGRSEPRGLDLRLNRSIPLELQIEAGAASGTLDLRELQVTDLRVETGASRGSIVLPATGRTRARIEGGATALSIVVPPGVAARITVDSGLSEIRVDEARFPRQGREYRSPDYDTADARVELAISVGAARVDVQ